MACRASLIIIFLAIVPLIAAYHAAGVVQDFRYEAHGRRDPFVPLIGHEKSAAAKLKDVTSIHELNLEGVAMGAEGGRVAILNGEMLREREKVGDVEIKKIAANSVTLSIDGVEHMIKLSEEGGVKGE